MLTSLFRLKANQRLYLCCTAAMKPEKKSTRVAKNNQPITHCHHPCNKTDDKEINYASGKDYQKKGDSQR